MGRLPVPNFLVFLRGAPIARAFTQPIHRALLPHPAISHFYAEQLGQAVDGSGMGTMWASSWTPFVVYDSSVGMLPAVGLGDGGPEGTDCHRLAGQSSPVHLRPWTCPGAGRWALGKRNRSNGHRPRQPEVPPSLLPVSSVRAATSPPVPTGLGSCSLPLTVVLLPPPDGNPVVNWISVMGSPVVAPIHQLVHYLTQRLLRCGNHSPV